MHRRREESEPPTPRRYPEPKVPLLIMIVDLLLTVAANLVGSLSAAIIVCELLGLPDPRTHGSRNPGATNVLRFGGKKAAAIVLVGDSVKGLLPVLVAQWLRVDDNVLAAVGLAGVATWLLVAKIFRMSSLAALIAALLAPLILWLDQTTQPVLIMSWVMSLLLLWRHRGNIQRLITGEEGRIGR